MPGGVGELGGAGAQRSPRQRRKRTPKDSSPLANADLLTVLIHDQIVLARLGVGRRTSPMGRCVRGPRGRGSSAHRACLMSEVLRATITLYHLKAGLAGAARLGQGQRS
ncbi:MAG: hypothetical protein ACRDQZ_14945 [Mycobacteriales bacterium]